MKKGIMRVMFRRGRNDPSIYLPTKRTRRLIWIIDAIVRERCEWLSLANAGSVMSGYQSVRSLLPTSWRVDQHERFIIVHVPYEERS